MHVMHISAADRVIGHQRRAEEGERAINHASGLHLCQSFEEELIYLYPLSFLPQNTLIVYQKMALVSVILYYLVFICDIFKAILSLGTAMQSMIAIDLVVRNDPCSIFRKVYNIL